MTNKRNFDRLTPRQRLFTLEYLKDLCATQAAIRAGYSAKTAEQAASRLLRNVKIAAEIQKAMDGRAERVKIDADQVLQELARLAFANMMDYIKTQPDGSAYVDLSGLDRKKTAAIQEITVEEYADGSGKGARPVRRTKFKLADKGINLERLGKHLELFTEKQKHEFSSNIHIDFAGLTEEQLKEVESRLAQEGS